MSIFKRLFKMGEAEAHALVDKLEDPIKLTEQGIRDLKKDLDDSLKAYAEVKALSIKARKDATDLRSKAASYEQKAVILIQKAEKGEIPPADADRLAGEALMKKDEAERAAVAEEENARKVDSQLTQLDANIKKLKSNIGHYENELKTLKARAKVSDATTKLNKQMAQIDGNGTISMLEKMKTKVTEKEALSEAYAHVADANKSLDDEIDEVIKTSTPPPAASDALAKLKEKLKTQNG
jgi:phage shock protein A